MKPNPLALALNISINIACGAALARAGDPPAVAGKWQVHSSIAGNESDTSCTFLQKAAELTGTCTSAEGKPLEITAGKLDGSKVSWTFKSEYNGTPITVTFEGALEGGKITGVVTVPEFSVSGDFTASPVQ